jgi:hypothetical protein
VVIWWIRTRKAQFYCPISPRPTQTGNEWRRTQGALLEYNESLVQVDGDAKEEDGEFELI